MIFNSHSLDRDIFAKIEARIRLEYYLLHRLSEFSRPLFSQIAWKKDVVNLVEIAYAFDAADAIPPKTISKLIEVFEMVFNISLKNHRIKFQEIKHRKSPSKFLNELSTALEAKLN